MPERLAADVAMLYKDDERFRNLIQHFKRLDETLQAEIMLPSTPAAEREILVHVRSRLKTEVVDVVELAQKVINMKQKTGQRKSPAER